MIAALGVGAVFVVPAAADAAPEVAQAVSAAREGASCGPLKYNPAVEHAADIVNRSTFTFLSHTSENVPIDEPHPVAVTRDLGIDADKVMSLQGAGQDEGKAIKGLLIQGRDAIPDCSYTDFGVSHLYESASGYHLVVAVLVGK
nr:MULTISPECIES: hypothetical protein [unclassified Mycolicibacterium]